MKLPNLQILQVFLGRLSKKDKIIFYIAVFIVSLLILDRAESLMITPAESLKEIIFLGLRKTEGINARNIPSSTIGDREALQKLIDGSGELICEGYLELNEDSLRLTRKGIVISNTIIVKLFEKLGL